MKKEYKSFRIPFHKSLFISSLTIFALFVTATFLYQYNREKEFRKQMLNDVLQTYNTTIISALEKERLPLDSINKIVDMISTNEMRVTLMDLKGNVIKDNNGDSIIFNNHIDRPEVKMAVLNGEGYAMRNSESLSIPFFYSAKRSRQYIVRSAMPFNLNTISYLKVDSGIISFFILMSLSFVLVIFFFSYRLGKTISTLRDFSHKAEKDQLTELNINLPGNDIGDITKHIIRLYTKLNQAKKDLGTEKEKLIKHLQISKEGLAVFDINNKPFFTNTLFIQYINLISDIEIAKPEDFINITEFERIRYFLKLHLNNDSTHNTEYMSENITISKNGKIFYVECIIFQDMTYEISINNITQQEEETRLKRQLTQNVAHELKTPVSSIRGYLETIITNASISSNTKQQFIERCYVQTNRLTGLLNDISILNRIDEAKDQFEKEPLNIGEIVEDMILESEQLLTDNNMEIISSIPENTIIEGNHSLIYSIFRNLIDNSIAYAGKGKSINIRCYHQDSDTYYFSFSDNGPGVEEKHLNRLFERFYRADKGRSRKLGGTGLGLAIVKNAVILHKGDILAKRKPEGGLEFLFSLKMK